MQTWLPVLALCGLLPACAALPDMHTVNAAQESNSMPTIFRMWTLSGSSLRGSLPHRLLPEHRYPRPAPADVSIELGPAFR